MKNWAVLLVFAAWPASASETTFGEIVEQCKAAQAMSLGADPDFKMLSDAAFCAGYIGGYLDGAQIQLFVSSNGAGSYCLPGKGISPEVVINLMRSHLDLNPDAAAYTARLTTYAVLSRAFPCPAK